MSNTIRTTWVPAVCCSVLLFSFSSVANAQNGGFTVLEFDTELLSLDLSGGPYPMPLASDPGNTRPGSVMGYGIVDSTVSISLTPGVQSLGEACAFSSGAVGTDGAKAKRNVNSLTLSRSTRQNWTDNSSLLTAFLTFSLTSR